MYINIQRGPTAKTTLSLLTPHRRWGVLRESVSSPTALLSDTDPLEKTKYVIEPTGNGDSAK